MIKAILFAVLFISAVPSVAEKIDQPERLKQEIENIMSKPDYSAFSGVLFVVVDGVEVISVGVGKSDIEKNIPFSSKTLMSTGSITKQFTAAAILKLEMLGKLSTLDTAYQYIPSLEGHLKKVTIHELLTHTAGITTETGNDDETFSSNDLVNHLNKIQLSHTVGEYHYSNLGYSLLGLVVENVSGYPLDQFLAKSLFEPIGMLKTGYTYPTYKDNEVNRGYLNGNDWGYPHKKNWTKTGPHWNLRGNGGMLSTVDDMYKWHNALHFSNHLSDSARKKLFAKNVREFANEESYYGYGWVIETLPNGNTVIWHNGGNGIFSADVRYYPSSNIYYYIAGNRSDGEIYDLSDEIHNLVTQD